MRCVFYSVYMLHDTQKPIHGLSMCHAHMFSFDFVVSFKHIANPFMLRCVALHCWALTGICSTTRVGKSCRKGPRVSCQVHRATSGLVSGQRQAWQLEGRGPGPESGRDQDQASSEVSNWCCKKTRVWNRWWRCSRTCWISFGRAGASRWLGLKAEFVTAN